MAIKDMPEAVKELFLTDNIQKNLRIHFPNGEWADLLAKDIVEESFKFTESICSRSKLKLGLCEASVIEFEYAGTNDIKGCKIAAFHEIDMSSIIEPLEYQVESADNSMMLDVSLLKPGMTIKMTFSENVRFFEFSVQYENGGAGGNYPSDISGYSGFEYTLDADKGDVVSFTIMLEHDVTGTLEIPNIDYQKTSDVAFPFYRLPYGVFKVDTCKKQGNSNRWKVVAYSQRMTKASDLNPVEIAKQEMPVAIETPYKVDLLTYICANIKNIYDAQPELFTEVFDFDVFEEKTYTLYSWEGTLETHKELQANCAVARWTIDEMGEDIINYLLKFNYSYVDGVGAVRADIMETTGLTDASKLDPFCVVNAADTYFSEGSRTEFNSDFFFYPYMTGFEDSDCIEIVLPLSVQYVEVSNIGHGEVLNTFDDWDVCKEYSAFSCRPVDTYYTQTLSFDRIENEEGGYICNPDSIDFAALVSAWLELNGLFGKVSRNGGISFFLMSDNYGLYPSPDLYPDETLFPNAPSGGTFDNGQYISVFHDKEYTKPYKKVEIPYKVEVEDETIQDAPEPVYVEEEREAVEWIGGNFYDISNDPEEHLEYSLAGNYLLKTFCIEDEKAQLADIAERVKTGLSGIQYMPSDAEVIGMPWIEAGDVVHVCTEDDVIETIVLRRVLKGIQSIRDSFESR